MGDVKGARLVSCPTCVLDKLPEVKRFAYEDLPKFKPQVEFVKKKGENPRLIFTDKEGNEMEVHQLEKLSRDDCNNLLQVRGFVKI